MNRRRLLAGVGGAAAMRPFSVVAQIARQRRIGVLASGTEGDALAMSFLSAFVEALGTLGWSDGHNIQIDVRWAGASVSGYDRAATEILALRPEIILAVATPAVRALHDKAGGVPVVFVAVTDPVGQRLISNLAHPDGNITGFLNYDAPMAGKWLSLLRDIAPGSRRAAPLFNPQTAPYGDLMVRTLQEDAKSLGIAIEAVPVSGPDGIEPAIAAQAGKPESALIVLPDGFTVSFRADIIAAAARHKVPAIYPYTFFVREGGLVSYGIDVADLFRNAAGYIDRILKGAKPEDLPVQAPTKFETAINLKTAKALGLTPSLTLQAMAEVVIE